MASSDTGSMSGFTAGEAREFHGAFVKSFVAFMGWAFAAHVLVWMWRPWSLSVENASLMDGVNTATTLMSALV